MALAAFLPVSSAEHLGTAVRSEELILTHSWIELESVVRNRPLNVVVLDPRADGSLNTAAVLGLMRDYPSVPLLAYVPLDQHSFRTIFKLSRDGLSHALVHPLRPEDLWRTIEAMSAGRLANRFLGVIEPSLGSLPAPVFESIQDLFEKPHRYQSAADIAVQARVSVRAVYRAFDLAQLGTPKKLLTIAKLIRGYCYLRNPTYSVGRVCRKLGYSHTRIMVQHISAVFQCCPCQLRAHASGDDILIHLLEWFYKPQAMRGTEPS